AAVDWIECDEAAIEDLIAPSGGCATRVVRLDLAGVDRARFLVDDCEIESSGATFAATGCGDAFLSQTAARPKHAGDFDVCGGAGVHRELASAAAARRIGRASQFVGRAVAQADVQWTAGLIDMCGVTIGLGFRR